MPLRVEIYYPDSMRTWTFATHPTGDGPWCDEPDKIQWIDETTDLDCLIVRAVTTGALCGYVGVPPGHPWHGMDAFKIPAHAHGDGLNYGSLCDGNEDGPNICHVPEPGRPADVWWIGFHCAGTWDVQPSRDADLAAEGINPPESFPWPRTYRTIRYVRDECVALATQVMEADGW